MVAFGHTRVYSRDGDTIFFGLCAAHVVQTLHHCKLGDNSLPAVLFVTVCSIPCNVSDSLPGPRCLYSRYLPSKEPNLASDMYAILLTMVIQCMFFLFIL